MEIYRAALDGELRECFSGREGFLYDLLRYHLGWVDQQGQPESGVSQVGLGESFHALAAPAVGEALTGEFEAALPVAAGVELLHNFTLVHGDVQAGRVEAGARPSIWWVWGPAQAINAGDGFHALARVAVMRLLDLGIAAERALAAAEMLDRTCLAMCEGQFADLGFQDKLLVTTAEYDAMIANKAGALTGYAAAGGALAVGADDGGTGPVSGAGGQAGDGVADDAGRGGLLGSGRRRGYGKQRAEQEEEPAADLYAGELQYGGQAGDRGGVYEAGAGAGGHRASGGDYGAGRGADARGGAGGGFGAGGAWR